VCTPEQYAQPGQPCDGESRRCVAGLCNKSAGACPWIVTDGAACNAADPSTVCDDYARCFSGTCQIPDPSACR
jgi:hypothetical protein